MKAGALQDPERHTDAPATLLVGAVLSVIGLFALGLALPRLIDSGKLAIGGALLAIVVFVGVLAAARLGKGAPLVVRLVKGRRPEPGAWRHLMLAGLVGVVLGGALVLILVHGLIPMQPALGARLRSRTGSPWWFPFALAVESSILEEIIFRLFLMSVTVWFLARGWRRGQARAGPAAVWPGGLVSASAFALAHVPAWMAVQRPTPVLVATVLLLNGGAGIVLGWIYWRRGIEAAILCHGMADLMIQGLGPLLV